MRTRIGILSFAHMHGQSYVSALRRHADIELVGFWDTDAARAQAMAEQFEMPSFPSEDALLSEALDGVIITSENARHRALTEKAALAGVRAILCEKPIASTAEDAQAMIDICAKQGVTLATAFPCRYSPVFQRGLALVRSGAIGALLAIRGTNRGTMPGGWFIDKALSGGGAVIDHTVHVADLNRLLLQQEATDVYAEIGNKFYGEAFDDTGLLSITYAGGAFATLDTSWSRPKTYPTWGDVTLEIVGTDGVLGLDLFAQSLSCYNDRAGQVTWPGWGSDINAGLIRDFVKLARGEEAPEIATGTDGLRALEVAQAAYRSAETGQRVRV